MLNHQKVMLNQQKAMNNKYRTIMMNKRYFILLLMGVVMSFSASAQEKGGRGYWTLAYSRTLIEGERSNGENTGIIDGRDGLAEFRILRFMPGSFKSDGTYTVENKQDGRARFLETAERANKCYLEGFLEDGSCIDGQRLRYRPRVL